MTDDVIGRLKGVSEFKRDDLSLKSMCLSVIDTIDELPNTYFIRNDTNTCRFLFELSLAKRCSVPYYIAMYYHGTSSKAAYDIAGANFDWRVLSRNRYGHGFYLTPNALIASRYAKDAAVSSKSEGVLMTFLCIHFEDQDLIINAGSRKKAEEVFSSYKTFIKIEKSGTLFVAWGKQHQEIRKVDFSDIKSTCENENTYIIKNNSTNLLPLYIQHLE
jgi:hypothetical protein